MPRPQPKEKSEVALVLADPDYDSTGADDKPLAKANPAAPPSRGDDWTRQYKALQSLPGFRREADAVEKLLQERNKDWRVQSYRGSDASEETLRSVSRHTRQVLAEPSWATVVRLAPSGEKDNEAA